MESSCRLAHLSVCACLSVGLSVRKVYCGKTANWIRMSLEMVSEVGRGMGVLDRGGDRQRERGSLGVNLGRPFVTNVDFATQLFPNYFGQDLFIFSRPAYIYYSCL